MNYLKQYGSKLIKNGFPIIPIKPGSKAPALKVWQKIKATPETLDEWLSNGHSESGIGVLAETCPGIDLDIRDEEISQKLLKYCQKELNVKIHRIGNAPKILIPFQTDEPFPKMYSNEYQDFLGEKNQIEILCKGQQYVCFHIHPDTGKPYQWLNGSILDTPRDQLPVLTRNIALKLIEYFHSIVPFDWELKSKEDHEPESHQDPLENLKPPLDISTQKIKKCLGLLNPDDSYQQWVKIGMALYHQSRGSAEGYHLWDEWSLKGPKHQEGDCESKWDTFKENLAITNPVTFASVLKLAKEEFTHNKLKNSKVKFSHVTDVMAKLGKINWLVKNYIEENTLGIFFGDPGSYKSFLALDIALNCALGTHWNGSETKQGRVVYIAGEGHGGLARRITAWVKETKADLSKAPIHFSEQSADLYNQEAAEEIANTVGLLQKEKPALVVIDTLARNFGPGDENSTADMNVFIEHVDKLIRDRFKCCVLLVHHTGHKEKNRARGSMALRGGVDFEYRIEKPEKLTAKMVCTKMKDGPEPEDTYFEGKSILLDFDGDEEITSLVFSKIDAPIKEEKKPLSGRYEKILKIAEKIADGNLIDRDKFKNQLLVEGLVKDQADFRNTIYCLEVRKNYLKKEGNHLVLVDEFSI